MAAEVIIYPYDTIIPLIKAAIALGEEDHLSDAAAAKACGVSERQIRNARFYGMNDYLLDRICVGLKLHPSEVVGIEQWIRTGLDAPKISKRKVSK